MAFCEWNTIRLEAWEWMSRFLQHTLPRGFARVRTFGWLHPAAKVRANRFKTPGHWRQTPGGKYFPQGNSDWQGTIP